MGTKLNYTIEEVMDYFNSKSERTQDKIMHTIWNTPLGKNENEGDLQFRIAKAMNFWTPDGRQYILEDYAHDPA